MPEMPEVETLKVDISKFLKNNYIKDLNVLGKMRWILTSNDIDKIKNKQILDVTRRGRYLIFVFDNQFCLAIHLGMSGTLIKHDSFVKANHDKMVIFFNKHILVFNDPRGFGGAFVYNIKNPDKKILLLGIEPLSEELTASFILNACKKSARKIKSLLMDNKIVTGIGNIYASEILFDAKIHPEKTTNKINMIDAKKIVISVKKIITNAINNGGSTLKDYRKIDGHAGFAQNFHKVYNKKDSECDTCNTKIKKIIISGRSTFYCPKCQK